MVVKWKSRNHVQLSATPWTIQSMEFSRPEYWSGKPFCSPGYLPNPGTESRSPALQADSLPTELWGKPPYFHNQPCVRHRHRNLFKEHGAKSSERVRFSLTTCPDAQSDDRSQPAVGASCSVFSHCRAPGAPSASTVRSTKWCPWRWSCSPGSCSSSVTLAGGSSCCSARPSEWAAGGRPRLHFRPPPSPGPKGNGGLPCPPQCRQRTPRAGSRQVAPPPPLSASQLCSQLPSSACSTPLWCGPVPPEDRFSWD